MAQFHSLVKIKENFINVRDVLSGRQNRTQFLEVHKKEIFDIIDSFRTQDAQEGERDAYYPVTIYDMGLNENPVIYNLEYE